MYKVGPFCAPLMVSAFEDRLFPADSFCLFLLVNCATVGVMIGKDERDVIGSKIDEVERHFPD